MAYNIYDTEGFLYPYKSYPTRRSLLDKDGKILPGKWKMWCRGIKLFGTELPIFESFDFVQKELGCDDSRCISERIRKEIRVISRSVRTRSSVLSVDSEDDVLKLFYNYVIPGDETVDGFFIYSLQPIESSFAAQQNSGSKSYLLRYAPKISNKIKSVYRDERIKEILEGDI